jgi:4-amino-4-deoxy-L-arabinose transferase-like glycosyltransferase
VRDRSILFKLPWLKAAVIIFIVAGIYYGSVEYYNPGFCKYFFINENILRFFTKDYGDRTGSGHAQFYGTSILFFIFSFLPWTPILIRSLYLHRPKSNDELFFLSATLAPIILFLFAQQHLATYQLPALIPAAILLSERISRRAVTCIAYTMFILYTLTGFFASSYINSLFSSAPAIKMVHSLNAKNLHFQYEIPLSAYWYISVEDTLDMATPFETETNDRHYFITREKHKEDFERDFGHRVEVNSRTGKWTLYESKTE